MFTTKRIADRPQPTPPSFQMQRCMICASTWMSAVGLQLPTNLLLYLMSDKEFQETSLLIIHCPHCWLECSLCSCCACLLWTSYWCLPAIEFQWKVIPRIFQISLWKTCALLMVCAFLMIVFPWIYNLKQLFSFPTLVSI